MRDVFVKLPDARTVLDFGCGTGWVLGEAHAEGHPYRIGIDTSFESIKQGKARNAGMVFVLADGLRLPFSDASFDVVIGHVSLPYMNTTKALQEIHRVLSPGGSCLLTFHSFHYVRKRLASSIRKGNWKDVIFMMYLAFNGFSNHLSLPQRLWMHGIFETVNTPTGVYRAARKLGFTMISIERAAKRVFFTVTARKAPAQPGAVSAAPGWSVLWPLR